jgi:dephospho-CoA kinase
MKPRPFLIGLTGSIGMGKSTTAGMFADQGIPVWDADTAVHELYEKNAPGTRAIEEICPDAIQEGKVSRDRLRSSIATDPELLKRIEAAIHPLVAEHRARFLRTHDDPILLLDIPLLFETGSERQFDAIVVVTADPDTQSTRVLERPGMTPEHLETILSRQLPDAEKRARADYIIDTSFGLEPARAAVKDIVEDIRNRLNA